MLLYPILVSVQDDRQGSKILFWVGLLEDRRGFELNDLAWQAEWQAVSPNNNPCRLSKMDLTAYSSMCIFGAVLFHAHCGNQQIQYRVISFISVEHVS